jgi:small basic protein (TIGR04137 family)
MLMSIDRSLKIKGALSRHRNVLSRAERLEVLKEQERWAEGNSVLGLPKVAHRKSAAGKKEKAEKAPEAAEAAAAAAPGAAATAPAAATAAKAPAAKTPAAGAKPAAPAAAKAETKKK